jgi:hypothetical protein
MTQELICKHSAYLRDVFDNGNVQPMDETCFKPAIYKFFDYYADNGTTDGLRLTLNQYIVVYEFLDQFQFDNEVMSELEKHYKGNTDINSLSGVGWDLYLPETAKVYECENIPRILVSLKTHPKFHLKITDLKEITHGSFRNDPRHEVFLGNFLGVQVIAITYEDIRFKIPTSLIQSLGNLKSLVLARDYDSEIDFTLSGFSNLRVLETGLLYNHNINLSHLKKLERLVLHGQQQKVDFSNLKNLKHLTLGHHYSHKIDFSPLVNLEELEFGSYYLHEIDLSNNVKLTRLIVPYEYNRELDLSYLINLKYLEFGDEYDQETDFSELVNLECLCFGISYNQDTDLRTNVKLRTLSFGDDFEYDVDLSTLTELRILKFGTQFKHSLDLSNNLKLECIELGDEYEHDLDLSMLKKLKTLNMMFRSKITLRK